MMRSKMGDGSKQPADDRDADIAAVRTELRNIDKAIIAKMDQRDVALQMQISGIQQAIASLAGNSGHGSMERGIAELCEQFAPLRQLFPQRIQPTQEQIDKIANIRADLARAEFSAAEQNSGRWSFPESYDSNGRKAS